MMPATGTAKLELCQDQSRGALNRWIADREGQVPGSIGAALICLQDMEKGGQLPPINTWSQLRAWLVAHDIDDPEFGYASLFDAFDRRPR